MLDAAHNDDFVFNDENAWFLQGDSTSGFAAAGRWTQ